MCVLYVQNLSVLLEAVHRISNKNSRTLRVYIAEHPKLKAGASTPSFEKYLINPPAVSTSAEKDYSSQAFQFILHATHILAAPSKASDSSVLQLSIFLSQNAPHHG